MKLFKKYTISAYGVKYSQYYFQDYVPEWLDYYFRRLALRLWHFVFGHRWGRWSKFSYVPEGETGFATIEDKQTRTCSCFLKQERAWSRKIQRQLADMRRGWGEKIMTGTVGELYSVRFISTNK